MTLRKEGALLNIFPARTDEVLRAADGASSEYQVMIGHLGGKDIMTLFFVTPEGA